MNTSFKLILFLLFNIIFIFSLKAQEKKRIEIEQAGAITIDEANFPGAKIITRDDRGQVHITHENITMWCDKAIQYTNDNFIEAYGHVKMIQGDTINMDAQYVEYSGKTQLAFASGEVLLTTPDSELKTDTLYFDRIKQQAYYRSGGTVVKDTSGTITSKIGRYYMELKKYKFVQDVVLINKESTINTNYFDFYEDTGHAYLYGPSTITTPESKTYCEKGFYDTNTKIGYAVKKAKIHYDNRIVEGDSLYFDNNESFASATNHIKVTDTLNNSIVKGHYAEVYKAKDSVFITKRALAITLQEKDSIYIHADTLMVTGKPEKRITRAFRNVKLYKTDMSGKADSVHVNHEIGLTQMINISRRSDLDQFTTKRKPILWNIKNQITGDTIHLKSNPETEKIDSLIVFENAFVISKDSLGAGYNQINGKTLIGLFNEDNDLYHVDILKNAQSIYYMRNEKNELIGIDKSKSGSIQISITNREIEEVRKLNQIDGNIYPESMFPDNEKFLKGFDWREEERPLSVDDLFKDDPPPNLTTIKGLEDYVPQEDFFDDTMLERIEKADKESDKTSPEEAKASRNIPQDIRDKRIPEGPKKAVK
ncbi:OstA-like protein [Aestuariivivens sediminis]|uniref:OstA-like protein n=1 Tax=Aestuariivivens sediminis TaxID=2913557 RepID=UPI001F5A6733|nr:OstA-like protein [Aestuariivivens sediminis]